MNTKRRIFTFGYALEDAPRLTTTLEADDVETAKALAIINFKVYCAQLGIAFVRARVHQIDPEKNNG